jgi:hypothetical protein
MDRHCSATVVHAQVVLQRKFLRADTLRVRTYEAAISRVQVGGISSPHIILCAVRWYLRFRETWCSGGVLNIDRYGHTATLLLDGQVLITGGVGCGSALFIAPNCMIQKRGPHVESGTSWTLHSLVSEVNLDSAVRHQSMRVT